LPVVEKKSLIRGKSIDSKKKQLDEERLGASMKEGTRRVNTIRWGEMKGDRSSAKRRDLGGNICQVWEHNTEGKRVMAVSDRKGVNLDRDQVRFESSVGEETDVLGRLKFDSGKKAHLYERRCKSRSGRFSKWRARSD